MISKNDRSENFGTSGPCPVSSSVDDAKWRVTAILPSEVVANAQVALNDSTLAEITEQEHFAELSPGEQLIAGHEVNEKIYKSAKMQLSDVLTHARRQIDEYYDYVSDGKRSIRSRNENVAALDTEEAICAIVMGVLARGAIFETLGELLETQHGCLLTESFQGIDYTTQFVDRYQRDGEHAFLTAIVGLLDEGLRRYYRNPHVLAYREGLRDAEIELNTAATACGKDSPPHMSAIKTSEFDPWTEDPDVMMAIDTQDVEERIRRALRHNSETVLQLVRIFPECIVTGYNSDNSTVPQMSVIDLQRLFLLAIPKLAIQASVRVTGPKTDVPVSRQDHPMSSAAFICDVEGGIIKDFHWLSPNLARPMQNGRCPANPKLPALSQQQKVAIERSQLFENLLFKTPPKSSSVVKPRDGEGECLSMSTVEALLRVATFVAPKLWRFQAEAKLLCPEFNANDEGQLKTIEGLIGGLLV